MPRQLLFTQRPHGRLSDGSLAEAGIEQGLIRIAVGLEDIEDIKNDLELGLSQL